MARSPAADLIPGFFSAIGLIMVMAGVVMALGFGGDWRAFARGFILCWGLMFGVFGLIGGFVWLSMVWK